MTDRDTVVVSDNGSKIHESREIWVGKDKIIR